MASYHLRLKNDSKPNGTKVSAKGHADYILREDGKPHAAYINREGENPQNDCIFKAVHLPSWADGSTQKFFSAATRYEDKGNRRFKEIEMSLPNELNLEQNREIVDRFIEENLKNHYHAYAIHEKNGAISGERHPHVHIMFSERLIDDVEKIKERPAYKYFSRAAKPLKGEKEASFERRREHGAPKDKRWHSKKYLCKIREDFARIQNEVLEKNGFSIRVDHRTLKAQKVEAEQRGNKFLANVFDRVPEEYIGIFSIHCDVGQVADLKHTRKIYKKEFEKLFQQDFREKILAEEAVKEMARQAEIFTLSLLTSENYKTGNFENEPLGTLKQKILTEFEKVKAIKKSLMTCRQAETKATSEYLPKADRILLREYENAVAEKYNLESLLKKLIKPSEKQPKNLQAFQEIESGVSAKISDLQKSMVEMYPKFRAVEENLKNPYQLKNVHLVTHSILQNNLKNLKELQKVSEKLLRDAQELKNLTESKEKPQTIFSFSELKENLCQQCKFLKSEYEKSLDEKSKLMWKVINSARAISMAENIFVHGDLKKLRDEKRKYEKAVSSLEKKFLKYQQREIAFKNANWKNFAEQIQEQYYLTKEKIILESAYQDLQNTKKLLDSESERLEKICKTGEARQKIAVIAAGILKKNLKVAEEYEQAKMRSKDLSQKLKLAKKRLEGLKENASRKLQNYVFSVAQLEKESAKTSSSNPNFIVSLIADALNGNENAVQLVAYCPDDCLRLPKDWNLISELEKDELLHKKIMREL
ncbi:MAG: MobA/MobL family protein [Selenomonadaceae bacterium]|nr:MobA/MobL family protein [Selenomonadaceae bacterium]